MKTNVDKFFKNDQTLESEGIWFMISDEVGFKIRRFGGANSHRIKAAMAKHYKPYARQIENGTLDPDKEKDIMLKVFIESCMLDWKGVEIDGELKDYSKEIAIPFFQELPELADTLSQYALDSKNFREDLGNS